MCVYSLQYCVYSLQFFLYFVFILPCFPPLLSCRYKPLCPDTWPSWNGRPVDGVSTLVKHLGYKPEEYKLGRLVIIKGDQSLESLSGTFCSTVKDNRTYLQMSYSDI